ncbi:MAG: hypothetical protein CM1200mP10_20180 [Candidatus Neomarinimicrobiota bacterium]|nr:MAG: hypothetical protein CM1200mP10_20180 [Candidatus Neomarinimicrobiota bacterium]
MELNCHFPRRLHYSDSRDVVFLKKEQIKKVTLRKVVENPQFRPLLRWEISSNDYNVTGDLVYMSRGFDWNAVYRRVWCRIMALQRLLQKHFI